MKFSTAWETDIGTAFAVSDGKPEPTLGTYAWHKWKTHNFTGVLVEKGGITPDRWLRLEIVVDFGTVNYTFTESMAVSFTTSGLSASALTAYAEELLEKVDSEAGDRLSLVDGLLLYAKWQEVRDINSIGLAGVQALSVAEREARFPFLTAELNENPALTGQQAVDRFTAQTTNKIARAARIEARRSRIARLLAAANTQEELETAIATGWAGV